MDILASSNHVVLAAIAGGIISAGLNSVIDDCTDAFIRRTKEFKIKTTLTKCSILSFTVGLLLSAIFYAFAVYAYPNANMTHVQIIVLFTLCFGLGYPLLNMLLASIRNQIFA